MTKRKSKLKSGPDDIPHFEALRPYIAKVSKVTLGKHHLFSVCVKSSICKCFEFNMAVRKDTRPQIAFFTMSSLRGICEDLIVLRYLKQMPSSDREKLTWALATHELATRVKHQDAFFSAIRPQQPVLRLNKIEKKIASAERKAQAIWNRHGWPNLQHGAMPQIRQIAEKQGAPWLAILYDYLYRLTSAAVHFNVQSLFRSGWGASPKRVTFSTRHFHWYFVDFSQIYGAFMFCLYFEFFGDLLRPSPEASAAVAEIRSDLLYTPRWPEMVTFEEMNLRPPKRTLGQQFLSALQAISRNRLVSGSVNYTKKGAAETRLVASLFRGLGSARKAEGGKAKGGN